MPTPDFILSLREKIGHDLLWLIGATGYVEDSHGRVLLERRADTGRWALVSGISEVGEEPAETVRREAREEAGVDVVVEELAAVSVQARPMTYPNGDQCQFLDLLFLCSLDPQGDTDPFVADDESLEVGWFELDALPEPLVASTRERLALVARYRAGDGHALFFGGGPR